MMRPARLAPSRKTALPIASHANAPSTNQSIALVGIS